MKESNKTLWILLAIVVALGLIIPISNQKSHESKGDLRIPFSSEEAKQYTYKELNTKLIDAGFTDIEIKKVDDLVIGWTITDGEIESVTINGMDTFDKSDWVPVDARAIIVYHTYRNKRF